jgi:hypothetical protein
MLPAESLPSRSFHRKQQHFHGAQTAKAKLWFDALIVKKDGHAENVQSAEDNRGGRAISY